jgi:hypothetical protein
MSLYNLTNNLLSDLRNGNLTRNALVQYFIYIKRNIEEIQDLSEI